MLGKTFKGLTDRLLEWQTRRLLELELGREDHVVHVRPELVVEIVDLATDSYVEEPMAEVSLDEIVGRVDFDVSFERDPGGAIATLVPPASTPMKTVDITEMRPVSSFHLCLIVAASSLPGPRTSALPLHRHEGSGGDGDPAPCRAYRAGREPDDRPALDPARAAACRGPDAVGLIAGGEGTDPTAQAAPPDEDLRPAGRRFRGPKIKSRRRRGNRGPPPGPVATAGRLLDVAPDRIELLNRTDDTINHAGWFRADPDIDTSARDGFIVGTNRRVKTVVVRFHGANPAGCQKASSIMPVLKPVHDKVIVDIQHNQSIP